MLPQSPFRVFLLALAALAIAATTARAEPENLGNFELSYYWVSSETDFEGPADTELLDPQCEVLATVTKKFARRLRLEGTGRLRDGRIVNTAGSCECGSPCYFAVSDGRRRWGVGVKNRALSPFRSVAVDTSVVPIGTRLYIPALDGVRMPGKRPWGGFVHDGCVIADDRGGGVRGREIDFFSGLRGYYRVLQRKHKFEEVVAYRAEKRCAVLGEGRLPQM